MTQKKGGEISRGGGKTQQDGERRARSSSPPGRANDAGSHARVMTENEEKAKYAVSADFM